MECSFWRVKAIKKASSGMVVYKSKMTHRKIKGGKKNFGVYTADEFIASITQHIPDKNFQLVRYYGWYSNKMRGQRLKSEQGEDEQLDDSLDEIDIHDVSDYKPTAHPVSNLA